MADHAGEADRPKCVNEIYSGYGILGNGSLPGACQDQGGPPREDSQPRQLDRRRTQRSSLQTGAREKGIGTAPCGCKARGCHWRPRQRPAGRRQPWWRPKSGTRLEDTEAGKRLGGCSLHCGRGAIAQLWVARGSGCRRQRDKRHLVQSTAWLPLAGRTDRNWGATGPTPTHGSTWV